MEFSHDAIPYFSFGARPVTASHGVVEGAILFAREAARPWNYRVMLCLSHERGLRTFRAYMKFQAVGDWESCLQARAVKSLSTFDRG